MMRPWLAAVAVFLTTTAAQAKLEVAHVECTHGPLLPERKAEYFPEDLIFFRYVVNGVKTDATGKVDVEAVVKLTDGNGKEVFKNVVPYRVRLSLGGDSFVGFAHITLNEQFISGLYTVTVTVTDQLASDKVSFQREVRIKPAEFAIIRPHFSYDAEGRAQASVGGLVTQTLHFRIEVYHFDKGQDRVHLVSSVQVLDAQGKELLPEPLETILKSEDAKLVKETTTATFNGSLGLHRAGEFTLRISVTDKINGKTTKLEMPLKVAMP